MLLSKKQVLNFLPHRDPFLFIDEVTGISLAEGVPDRPRGKDLMGSIVCAKYMTLKDHPIFKGHFPGNPILPGVVQVEMMAQAAAFIITQIDPEFAPKNLNMALLGISGAKFRRPILPEMVLEIKSKLDKSRGLFMNHSCEIYCNGQLMSEACIFASV